MHQKPDGTYICDKTKKVMDTVTHLTQTQPEVPEAAVWLEATGGVQKGGFVFGFVSDIEHFFPEVVRNQKSKSSESYLHTSCEEKIRQLEGQLEEQNRAFQERLARMESAFVQFSANPEGFASFNPNVHTPRSQQNSGFGFEDINTNEEMQPASDDANNDVEE